MRARSATIVGGGVGGAAAALLLAGVGVETVMVERSATPTLAGAALALAPNGLAVLDGLGLGDAVRARACALRGGAAVRDRDGRVLQRVAPPDLGTRYDHLAIIRRRDLLEILYEALHAAPRVDVRLGVEQAPDAPLDGDLVVGADGIGSVVRVQVDPASEVRPLGVAYMRALVDAAVPDDLVGEWWTPLGLFGVLPVNDASYVYGAASAPPLAAAIAARDIGAYRDAWRAVAPRLAPVLDALDDVDALLLNDVAEVHCTRFAAGNVALVGDAAHAMTPNLGQGANSALVDVAVLGHALTSHDVVEIALGAYDERRRAPVQRVQRTARTLLRLSNAHGAAYSRVRDALLRASSPIAARSAARTFRTVLQEQPQWLAETTAAVSGQPAASGAG